MPTCPIEDNPTHCLSIHLSLPSFTRRTQNHFSSFFVLKTLLFLLQKILRRSLLRESLLSWNPSVFIWVWVLFLADLEMDLCWCSLWFFLVDNLKLELIFLWFFLVSLFCFYYKQFLFCFAMFCSVLFCFPLFYSVLLCFALFCSVFLMICSFFVSGDF